MKARWLALLLGLIAIGFWHLSRPVTGGFPSLDDGDAKEGSKIAIAAGCASCHGEDYSGGTALHSPFGSFYAPNITPAALGNWSVEDYANAIRNGVSPEGQHYYPSFPYMAYRNMKDGDLVDLIAHLQQFPAVEKGNLPHDLPLYARLRRPLGVWKRMNGAPDIPEESRGAYLVETLAHCQECHSPRNALGILQYDRAFDGGVVYNEMGKVKSKVPSLITGDSAHWDRDELLTYLSEGFTPDYDSAGGEMVEVVENIARLPREDQEAIADYILKIRSD